MIQVLNDFADSTPVDLVIVVDTSEFANISRSMDQALSLKSFLKSFVKYAKSGIEKELVKVAIVTYSTHPKVELDLGELSNAESIMEKIESVTLTSGERNTADAMGIVRTKVLRRARQDVPNVVLLITTGKSDRNSVRTLQESDGLKYARTTIFAVGINLTPEAEEELNEIASKPTAENTFLLGSFFELEIINDILFDQIFASKL